jgi:hypothetical protein
MNLPFLRRHTRSDLGERAGVKARASLDMVGLRVDERAIGLAKLARGSISLSGEALRQAQPLKQFPMSILGEPPMLASSICLPWTPP